VCVKISFAFSNRRDNNVFHVEYSEIIQPKLLLLNESRVDAARANKALLLYDI